MNPDWILLRGWTREAAHWGPLPDLMREALPGGRILPLDLPGCGERRLEHSPLRPEPILRSLRQKAIDELGPLERVRPAVLALSFGAMLAYAWACRHPDDFSRLVLINPSFRGINPWYERLRLSALPRLLTVLFDRDVESVEKKVLSLVSNSVSSRDAALQQWIDIRRSRAVTRQNALRQLIVASRLRVCGLPRDCPPILILASQTDRLVSVNCSIRIGERLGVPVRFHPAAGHDLPLDDPHWVVRQLQDQF